MVLLALLVLSGSTGSRLIQWHIDLLDIIGPHRFQWTIMVSLDHLSSLVSVDLDDLTETLDLTGLHGP